MKRTVQVVTFMLVLIVASTSFGSVSIIPSHLVVDFRSDDWAPAFGQQNYSFDGVTAETNSEELKLHQDEIDGLGVLGGENDEIDGQEAILVTFEEEIRLGGVWITDLYKSSDGGAIGEIGTVVLNGVTPFIFKGENSHQANGEQWVAFGDNGIVVKTALFYTIGEEENNEFSVAGFTHVPAPGAILLASFGCGIVSQLRRRKRV